ncbi:MAG: spore maturation protein [Firmicutes bacterium]|nr:spore maturation protein [Bacillota bacterium]
MVNTLWLAMILGGIAYAVYAGTLAELTPAIFAAAETAVQLIIGMLGVMAFWLGMAKVMERSGLMQLFVRILQPIIRPIFPSIPRGHPALGSILLNLTANLLGLGNAATPLGLAAMKQLQTLNPRPREASDAMCTFLALNTSCITLIPSTVIAVRAASGAARPTDIIGTTIISTLVATSVALLMDRLLRQVRRGR